MYKHKREILKLCIMLIIIIFTILGGLTFTVIKNTEDINYLKNQTLQLQEWTNSVEKNGISIK